MAALHLCFAQHSQFLVARLHCTAGQLVVSPQSTEYCPDWDLVDYTVTGQGITAVWTTGEGDTMVRRTTPGRGWQQVTTADADQGGEELELGPGEDARQTYLAALFAPGAFLATTLAKTVAIFRRRLREEGVVTMGWVRLRQEVVAAVEGEVQAQLTEYEVSDEEYVATSRQAWARFHSCACQYRTSGLQPQALVASHHSAVLLIRRELVSWLRPVEALEQVVVTGGQGVSPEIFSDIPPLSDNPALAQDVLRLVEACGLVGRLLPQGASRAFSEGVARLQSPDLVSRSLAAEMLAEQEQPGLVQEVQGVVGQCQDLGQALECLLYCLELDRGSVSSGALDISLVEREGRPRVFSSSLGVSLVAETLRQQVETRLWLAQQLLVTQHLLLSLSCPLLPPETLDTVQSTFLPRTTVMVHCYSTLHWLCSAPAAPPSPALLLASSRQLAVLRLGEDQSPPATPEQGGSLLELFLAGPGSKVRCVVGEGGDDAWLTALPPLTNMTAQLLWPRCAAPTFLEFLLTSRQHALIQQYCRWEHWSHCQ